MLVSRSVICSNSECDNHLDQYAIVMSKTHLLEEIFDCGCKQFTNKYYIEFNFPSIIWDEIFEVKLSPGEKLVNFKLERIKTRK